MRKTLWVLIVSLFLFGSVGCDGHSNQTIEVGDSSIEFTGPVRTVLNVLRSELEVEYEFFVNDGFVDSGLIDGSGGNRITLNLNTGDVLRYRFDWWHKDFNVQYAAASGELLVNGSRTVTPSYDYDFRSDGDSYTNEEELDRGFSPLRSSDNPDNPFVPMDSRRARVSDRVWNAPVFACRNIPGQGSNSWYWILESDNTLSGIDSPDNYNRGRGFWEFVEGNRLSITNENNQTYLWQRTTNDAELSLVNANWGECVRIAGPGLQ